MQRNSANGTRPSPGERRTGDSPESRFLSNGDYTLLITQAGTGLSSARGRALTRWFADRVEDDTGFFLFLRDLESRAFWSVGSAPVQRPGSDYEALWRPGTFQLHRLDEGIESALEIHVLPDAAAEVRELRLRNVSGRRRRIEVTTYLEVVLAEARAFEAHPAFSKLFVQTHLDRQHSALLASRRARAEGDDHPWLVHALLGAGLQEYETDRARFLGRGFHRGRPLALCSDPPLSGTVGYVLDPILSLRRVMELEHGESTSVSVLLGTARTRADALALVKRFASAGELEKACAEARALERSRMARLELTESEAGFLQSTAGGMLYGDPRLRTALPEFQNARANARHLEHLGLSPNRHLAIVHAEASGGPVPVSRWVRAHAYWQSLQLPIDLVVVSDEQIPTSPGPGAQPLQLQPRDLAPGVLDSLHAFARLIVTGSAPEASSWTHPQGPARPRATERPVPVPGEDTPGKPPSQDLQFFNGSGGFTTDGREYVIRLAPHAPDPGRPPMPWTNCVANERFGFLFSESGAGCTWSGNSREHRLTPWTNDPILDPHAEAFYVRDEESGGFWSLFPGPRPLRSTYEVRHGLGYSRCHVTADGLDHTTLVFVPRHDPLRVTRIHIRNLGRRNRRLSFYSYYRLRLGDLSEESERFVVTDLDASSKTMLAWSRRADDFEGRVTFASVLASREIRSIDFTGDRATFLGTSGRLEDPAGLRHADRLDGRVGSGLAPCIAQQVVFDLPPGESLEVCFLFGEGKDLEETRGLVARYDSVEVIDQALQDVRQFWQTGCGAIQVSTPLPELDLMLNGWLPYQTVACRLWGRTAFYQSGGAFGFRDQLQDAASMVYLWPGMTRAQILLHAASQFVEGDVLHWWHPPLKRGIRTRFADDLLWLPYLTAAYVTSTGDWDILGESIPYLKARPLQPEEQEAYLFPEDSGTSGTLYEHCCRAIERSLSLGQHGLPLFGCGDWNDGMNRVGCAGKGESVWMGFFLYEILRKFNPICERQGDGERARRYARHREQLENALNTAGWDGEWYRRGYYDDGAALGSRQSDECQIDALAQAWAVMSGVANQERAAQAMDAVECHLISEDEGLIRLLTPPFDRTPHDPGYIKGYVPGVRENGGQYTHAALWVVRAMAELGRNNRAARLLEMLLPVNHARTPEQVRIYQVEPYVVAADVYGAPPHVGRGGWTWYTGSAGWMYRVALESILGFSLVEGKTMLLKPCIPDDWPGFSLEYRLPEGNTRYAIRVRNPDGRPRAVIHATVDGRPATIDRGAAHVALHADERVHRVEIRLGDSGGRD